MIHIYVDHNMYHVYLHRLKLRAWRHTARIGCLAGASNRVFSAAPGAEAKYRNPLSNVFGSTGSSLFPPTRIRWICKLPHILMWYMITRAALFYRSLLEVFFTTVFCFIFKVVISVFFILSRPPNSKEVLVPGRSKLLDDFRNNRLPNPQLHELVSHIVEFSQDQHGSRYVLVGCIE